MRPRGLLFRKYVVLFVALVGGALITSGLVEIYFTYQESKTALVRVQREKAAVAASRIEQFVTEVERQLRWITQSGVGAVPVEQRRFDALRLLRHAPAITEVSHLDAAGREQLRVSRLAMDVIGSQADFSHEPKFVEAKARKTYFSPIYFRKESEPYMTIALAGSGDDAGVTVAEVNLKFIWDVVSQIKIGKAGRAYVVDSRGNLIAHPDISLVLQKTDLSSLPYVRAAATAKAPGVQAAESATIARDLQGRQVLTAYAPIAPLGWLVFVDLPLGEAFAPLYASMLRTGALLLVGLALSVAASLVLARRMVTPIQALQTGAARLGSGDLGYRLKVRTGDELENLADQFNTMAAQLQESYAGLEQRVEERTRDLREALEQQTATSEVLRILSSSPTDLEPVFDTILENATRLCEAQLGALFLYDGQAFETVALHGATPEFASFLRRAPIRPGPNTGLARLVRELQPIHIPDVTAGLAYQERDPLRVATVELEQARTWLVVPMLKERTLVGVIAIYRREVHPFSDKQIALLKTFADQAVIAIENVRLFQELQARNRDLTEALEQQTATSEILRVISSSPTDLQPVLDAVAENAARLCEASDAQIFRVDGDVLRLTTTFGALPAPPLDEVLPLRRGLMTGRAVLDRQTIHVHDAAEAGSEFPDSKVYQMQFGYRTALATPLLREGNAIGVILIRRPEVRPFSEKQIELLKTFADQAVIAIENVRLFQELQARNRDLTEALEQQTATSEVLRIISSSPTDLVPVYQAILANVTRLCEANIAALFLYDGQRLAAAAHHNATPAFAAHLERNRPRPSRETSTRLAALERRMVHVADLLTDPDFSPTPAELYRAENVRTVLSVPMLRETALVGVITVWRREVRPFTDKQIELLKTFADQAVIAIENVRLFQELQARTQELARSVEELRALSEVSQAVSSTLDLQNVLATVAAHAVRLSGTDAGAIYEFDEASREFHLRATHQMSEELIEAIREARIRLGETGVGQAAVRRGPVQIPDILDVPSYPLRDVLGRAGFRAVLAVPILREDAIIGGLVVRRRAPGTFPKEVLDLLETFASQSALAIQNARLFREVDDKSRELDAANRHKSEFLANMSHELRTPLNAVIGFSEVLLERMFGELNAKQAEYLDDILASGRHLLSLINDILDLSKVEAGRMELELAPFDLPLALDNALILVRERAARHGIALDCAVDDGLGPVVADERKVKQVLLNLLSNAVKFTPEGGRVTLAAKRADGVEVSVTDTGIGIAPEDQQAIFEEFRQVGPASSGGREGTGLGLTLARKLVELHGGRIRVLSAPGKGSTFTFTIPERPWPAS